MPAGMRVVVPVVPAALVTVALPAQLPADNAAIEIGKSPEVIIFTHTHTCARACLCLYISLRRCVVDAALCLCLLLLLPENDANTLVLRLA